MGKLWIFLQKRKSTREVIALIVSVVFPLVVAGWAIFTYVFPPDKPGAVSPTPTVRAAPGGVAAGRDISDSTVNIGQPPLAMLGERESGTAHLEEAVATFDAALAVFIAAKAEYYVENTGANRDRALRLIAQRRGGGK
jgi:hypothetical protein